MATDRDQDGIDHKIPTWNGDWTTFSDYVLRVELRADATKKDDKFLLGPRLAGNLTGRAFDALGEVNREELRKEGGWKYLLEFLESRRGKEKIDVLGDLFTEFFVKKESHRKDGEDLTDYEPRFRQLVRRLDKAVADTGSIGKIPTELYGWVLLNLYMKLDASNAANVRGRAESYKLDDIMGALKKMWSGGGLCTKDLERKKRKDGQTYVAQQTSEPSIYHETEETYEKDSVNEELEEQAILEDATAWYQEALDALLEEPEDSTILATFKEARKALDAARTARGFYPVRNPNARREGYKGFGKKGYSGKGGDNPHADKQRLRCGKRGHIARNCPQRPQQGRGSAEGNGGIGFVGWNEEADQGQQGSEVYQVSPVSLNTHAILDSGASDNIVGVETLQDWSEQLELLGFAAADEIYVDRQQHKRFTFGNNASAAALGKAYVNVGLFGHQLEVEVHLVEGATPFLLIAKLLADLNATVNFRNGTAVFRKLSNEQYVLSRTAVGHLAVPLLAYAGNSSVYIESRVSEPDPVVQAMDSPESSTDDDSSDLPSAEKGRPEDDQH